MNHPDDERFARLLRAALPPVGHESGRDLWPRMRYRIERAPARWPVLDLALAAAVLGLLIAFPRAIPWLLLQC
ncbi:MAG: hypothetical protein JST11_22555 [Acidobacteria bacterium]|nr:hypothetical protein [Acidobacteriota bacterium]